MHSRHPSVTAQPPGVEGICRLLAKIRLSGEVMPDSLFHYNMIVRGISYSGAYQVFAFRICFFTVGNASRWVWGRKSADMYSSMKLRDTESSR